MGLHKWSRKFTYVLVVSFPSWNEASGGYSGWIVGTLESEKICLGPFALFLPFLYPSQLLLHRGTLNQIFGYISDRRCEKTKWGWWSNPEISSNKQVVLNGEKQVGSESWGPGAQVMWEELDFYRRLKALERFSLRLKGEATYLVLSLSRTPQYTVFVFHS